MKELQKHKDALSKKSSDVASSTTKTEGSEVRGLTNKEKLTITIIKKLSMVVDYVILFLSLAILIIGVYSIWDTNQVFQVASSEQYEMYKPDSTDGLS
ncbi:hypothetical protein D3X11_04575 [Streptococcus sp. X16XC17]|uniref:hypothetical protein n=1 Tax=unclassified Streptococcus TaxID=2608887 RepID=UPI00066FBE4F|nr:MULTISPECIES: hypothetical protein [unclassified Streptococcus]TCD46653.1 hypothetical protein D3X11_04575 [Streptococcus sp. X16XC17]